MIEPVYRQLKTTSVIISYDNKSISEQAVASESIRRKQSNFKRLGGGFNVYYRYTLENFQQNASEGKESTYMYSFK